MRSSFSFVGAVIALVVLTSGCSATDSGYQGGDLGNGGFYLSCDDAVACASGTDDAKKFPKTVAVGSTFSVRFTNVVTTGSNIQLTNTPDQGITIDPIGRFITRGVQGLSGQAVGIATIAAHDASGQLIDFVNIEVGKPDALVIYDATDTSGFSTSTPTITSVIELDNVGDTRTLRAFAQRNKTTLAGTLATSWTSSDPTIVDVQSADGGGASVVGVKSGTSKITATGGTFTASVEVTVP